MGTLYLRFLSADYKSLSAVISPDVVWGCTYNLLSSWLVYIGNNFKNWKGVVSYKIYSKSACKYV